MGNNQRRAARGNGPIPQEPMYAVSQKWNNSGIQYLVRMIEEDHSRQRPTIYLPGREYVPVTAMQKPKPL